MITLPELFEDARFKEYFCKIPPTPRVAYDKSLTKQWVVYVQLKDPSAKSGHTGWKRKEFRKYRKAFALIRQLHKEGKLHDGAISNKRATRKPPSRMVRIKGKYIIGSDGVKRQATKMVVWKPRLEPEEPEHHWCLYCGRPTIFRYFTKHHRFTSGCSDEVPRCVICGTSSRIAIQLSEQRFIKS